MQNWKSDIKNWEKITPEKAKFAFELSAKRLESTIKIKDALDDKAFKLITILIPIQTTVITLLITLIHNNKLDLSILIPLLNFILLGFISICYSISIFKPKNFYLPGNQPDNLWKDELLKQDEEFIIFNESCNHQDYIYHNDKYNNLSVIALNNSTKAFLFALILSLILYFILKCLMS